MAAKKAGIRAHVGAEVAATDGSRYTLLVETRAGYQNLCHLITRMKLRAGKGEGAVTPEELLAMPDRGHLVADRDRHDHDFAAAGTDRHKARLGNASDARHCRRS